MVEIGGKAELVEACKFSTNEGESLCEAVEIGSRLEFVI
jgi:hypothetical protein